MSRVQRHIAVMTASLEPNAIVYRAERNDDRSAHEPITSDVWTQCESKPTNFNWFKYDYRVVTAPVFDWNPILEATRRANEIAASADAGAYENADDAKRLLKAELEAIVSKL
jgi:hypothetical protein